MNLNHHSVQAIAIDDLTAIVSGLGKVMLYYQIALSWVMTSLKSTPTWKMLHEIIKKERPDQQCDLVPGEEEPQLDLERHETTRWQSLAAQRWPRQVIIIIIKIIIIIIIRDGLAR